MRASGPKDIVRHGYRKSGTPFKFAFRAPVGASQIDAAGRWFKSPTSRSRFIRHNCAFWTSNGSHGRTLPFKPRKVMAMTGVGSENERTGADVCELKTLAGENASAKNARTPKRGPKAQLDRRLLLDTRV